MPTTIRRPNLIEALVKEDAEYPFDFTALGVGMSNVVSSMRTNLSPDALLRQTLELEGSFTAFAKASLPMLVPNAVKWSWPHDAMAEHLEAVTNGEIQNLIICAPPRCLKSSIVSVCWPCWEWTKRPDLRYLFTSYDLDLTTRDNEYARRIIKSPWYQDRWGDKFQILQSADAKRLFENDRNGRRLASSVNSRATGEGGDRLVVDDPHNARTVENENERKAVIEWWTQTMSSRVNTADAVKVITAQRTHHADVIGHAWSEMLTGCRPRTRCWRRTKTRMTSRTRSPSATSRTRKSTRSSLSRPSTGWGSPILALKRASCWYPTSGQRRS
jgi:hypothetical protein